MRLLKTVAGLRTYLERQQPNQKIALVPTMGALHNGHVSLIKRAVAESNLIIVSIFVNPLQFSPEEDFDKYPRQLNQDCRVCEQIGVDAVFAPSSAEMGGEESTVVVPPASMLAVLCGPHRPKHFQGVATVVSKLLNIVQPDVAYFGAKDAQQVAIVRRMVADLKLPVEIRTCPIVREEAGLALSSRNQYLSAQEQQQALSLSRSLERAQAEFERGERKSAELLGIVQQTLMAESGVEVEYIELVHPDTLEPLTSIEQAGLLAIACTVGSTRLIDNVVLQHREPIITIDGPAGAGKSTVARQVAHQLGLLYLDTGAMYRAVTWLVLRSGIDVEDAVAIAEQVEDIQIDVVPADSFSEPVQVKVNGENVTDKIRSPKVTANVSAVSAQAAVRRKLVKQQREIGQNGGIVAEGRDIGTNVFPQAELKIFLTASAAERAKRRAEELPEVDLAQLQQEIERRDQLDSRRSLSPLRKAADAVEINTDDLNIQAVTEQILALYYRRYRHRDSIE
ncbi:MAG: bifunctional pantoate--beta-alanine ligase/(d)CMP kinase [Cyanophyceae cyanobacterium]